MDQAIISSSNDLVSKHMSEFSGDTGLMAWALCRKHAVTWTNDDKHIVSLKLIS